MSEKMDKHIEETAIVVGQHIEGGGKYWQLRPRLGLFLNDDDLKKLVGSYLKDYREIKNHVEKRDE